MRFGTRLYRKNASDDETCCFQLARDSSDSLYDLVERARDEAPECAISEEGVGAVPLEDIVPLHNIGGLQSVPRIVEMRDKILSGRDILEPDGFPNIKLVRASDDRVIIFDGHHTALAYMACGRETLSEVPYLFIEQEDGTGVPDIALNACYGGCGGSLPADAWKTTVINWQASGGNQLELRRQETLGDLYHTVQPEL